MEQTNTLPPSLVKAVTWSGEELGANFDVVPLAESDAIDAALKESAQKYHEELVELAVEQDEDVLMAYLDVSELAGVGGAGKGEGAGEGRTETSAWKLNISFPSM